MEFEPRRYEIEILGPGNWQVRTAGFGPAGRRLPPDSPGRFPPLYAAAVVDHPRGVANAILAHALDSPFAADNDRAFLQLLYARRVGDRITVTLEYSLRFAVFRDMYRYLIACGRWGVVPTLHA